MDDKRIDVNKLLFFSLTVIIWIHSNIEELSTLWEIIVRSQ